MASKNKSIWLNYDLGLKGNYSALFTFLDDHAAIDCGNGLAYFRYDNNELLKSEELIRKLEKELSLTIQPSVNDRIYVIWKNDDKSNSGSVKGRFLFGKRKSPQWNGYATRGDDSQDDVAF